MFENVLFCFTIEPSVFCSWNRTLGPSFSRTVSERNTLFSFSIVALCFALCFHASVKCFTPQTLCFFSSLGHSERESKNRHTEVKHSAYISSQSGEHSMGGSSGERQTLHNTFSSHFNAHVVKVKVNVGIITPTYSGTLGIVHCSEHYTKL